VVGNKVTNIYDNDWTADDEVNKGLGARIFDADNSIHIIIVLLKTWQGNSVRGTNITKEASNGSANYRF
jgi:hypothetical protein